MTDPYEALGLESMDEPHWRRWLAAQMVGIQKRQDVTNGRLTRLEQFRWMSVGALAVVSAIVVPLFLDLVL